MKGRVINMEKNEVKNEMVVSSLSDISSLTRSNAKVFTTINDEKVLFNLNNNCDKRINDCVGENIKVKGVYIKVIESPLAEPKEYEDGTIQETEYKKITIIVDDKGKSYVTASKMFANQFIQYLQMCGTDTIVNDGLEIKIIKRNVRNSSNQALGFELV